ncbi:MAG: response regulator transcription factor [Candidatus Krumholzibacteria bacterium]|nr:response regulator transcription factor [Candidatus Krumholzibacteria bacterium]
MPERETLGVLVVDDEKPARNDITRLLGAIEGFERVGEAGNGIEAVKSIKKIKPDIVLLDIQMPGLDGFQVLKKLAGIKEMPAVIFITAYDEYALEAFEVHAVDYILKPVEEKRLTRALDRAARILRGQQSPPDLGALLETINAGPERLALRREDSHVMVDVTDILYATSSGGEVKVITAEIEGTAGVRSLDELQAELPPRSFVRVHRSFLANISRIHEITPWFSGTYRLRMRDGRGPLIPLSRNYAKELRKILKW